MNKIALYTIIRREVGRFMRIWSQTLIPSILTSSLFIIIFGYSLGSRISNIEGVSYLEFIIPGLLMMGVIMSAYAQSSFSLFIMKFQGSIQELLLAPITYWQIIIGQTVAALLRSLLVGAGILLISLAFTNIQVHSVLFLILFVVLTAALFSFAGIATALWAENFDKMNIFSVFLITPLTYLGGVFYSISMLPPLWQSVAKFNPILYMVDGFRYGLIGVHDMPLNQSLIIVISLTLLFFVICVRMFKTGYNIRS